MPTVELERFDALEYNHMWMTFLKGRKPHSLICFPCNVWSSHVFTAALDKLFSMEKWK